MADIKTQNPSPSSWINEEFVQTALNSDSDTKIIVEKVVLKDNDNEGLGYTSNILRIVATVRRDKAASSEQVHLIVKSSQGEGRLKELADENNAFQTESLLLCEILPEAHRLLSSVEGEAFRPLSARCFLSGKLPVEFLVIEDLSTEGFRLPAAGRPLDYHHCAAGLRAYARQHAGSVGVLKDRPEYRHRPALTSRMIDAEKRFFKDMLDKVCKTIAREFRTIPGYERYADKYEQLADRTVDTMAEYWTANDVRLPVVIHCDSWQNNFMFKYAGEAVSDVRIIDYQMSRLHSPAADVVSFLYVSASEEVHRSHLGGLLEDYHGTLQATLRALGLVAEADSYSWNHFAADVDSAHALAVFNSSIRGMVLMSEEFGAEFAQFFDNTDDSSDALTKACRHPDCLSYLKYVVPILEEKGVI